MKAVILAGGFGTRLSEETSVRPKPMVEIGGKPILWHIMNIYAVHGVNEFIIALGYKGEVIKEYFLNFFAFNNDITIDLASGNKTIHQGKQPKWKVHLVDTGLDTQTGGRLKRLRKWFADDEPLMLTYGDGVADINIRELLAFHNSHAKLATVTMVRPAARFGRIITEDNHVVQFNEKPQTGEGWINGGFFILNKGVLDYINDDKTVWERDPLEKLASDGELVGYQHDGFWYPMDTLRDRRYLEEIWNSGKAPWKVWA